MGVAPSRREDRSVADLLRELRDETLTLFRQEVSLAKTEVNEKVSRLTRNSVYIALGGGIVGAGALFVLLAASRGLQLILLAADASEALALWLSPLIVGIVVAVVGYIFIKKGQYTIKHEPATPEKTVQSLKEDKEWTARKIR